MNHGAIAENIVKLQQSIQLTAEQCGRDPKGIRLILVTKTVPVSSILEAIDAGIHEFGENRVQELLFKKKELGNKALWHMIGHLQTNKVKVLLDVGAGFPRPGQGEETSPLPFIHSLDREDLAEEIEKQAGLKGLKHIPCLIQVNSSGEASKFGLHPEVVEGFVQGLQLIPAIQIKGLMTIGPLTEDEAKIRKAFRQVRELQKELQTSFPEKDFGILSMGMSGDYKIAIEEGATLLRIGTAVFGERISARSQEP